MLTSSALLKSLQLLGSLSSSQCFVRVNVAKTALWSEIPFRTSSLLQLIEELTKSRSRIWLVVAVILVI